MRRTLAKLLRERRLSIVLALLLTAVVIAVPALATREHLHPEPAALRIGATTELGQGERVEVADITARTQSRQPQVAGTGPASLPDWPLPPRASGPALPEDVPVAELFEALESRARAGDVAAACRIAAEVNRCRSLPRYLLSAEHERGAIDAIARADVSADERASRAAELADSIEYNRRIAEQCQALSPQQLRAAPRYYLLAAQRGHVPSMARFANAIGAGGADMVADPELYALYRQHAWPMFRAAFEAGHPFAVMAWRGALDSNGFSFLAGALPPDWQTPGVARALSELVADASGLPRGHQAAEEVISDGDRLRADALYQQYFERSAWMQRQRELMRERSMANAESRWAYPRHRADTKHCEY